MGNFLCLSCLGNKVVLGIAGNQRNTGLTECIWQWCLLLYIFGEAFVKDDFNSSACGVAFMREAIWSQGFLCGRFLLFLLLIRSLFLLYV